MNEKPKGFGYVEFQDLASLVSALELNGEVLLAWSNQGLTFSLVFA